ncbi:nucleoside permease [Terracidiphilus gabretensis]|uniref:nucleoside permease n=1 Tax=Terracidiphilus gabretensis TaxID=1577687 RepID=UPI00071B22E3|nr:nucleoside permease [Terracidiphilus gabretensis]
MLLKIRLAVMMFLEFFIWGAWSVTINTWAGNTLHFNGVQTGLLAGTTAIGAVVSPFLAGWIADNLMAAQYMLALLHLAGGILLYLASMQMNFGPLYGLVLAYAVLYMPTLGLVNAIAFRQMRDPKTEFAPIRVLGTIGWICAGLIVSYILHGERTSLPLKMSAIASIVLAGYSLTLPHTSPQATEPFRLGNLFPVEVRRMFRDRSFLIFALASFLICVPLAFYYAFANRFLDQIGVANSAGKMTLGQASETLCMLLIPFFFRRLGVKWMLVAGMAAWALRYACFAFGNPGPGVWMLLLGIVLHGICYDFFFVTGQIYTDRKAPAAYRSAAQGMITLITYGIGMLLGSWLSGKVVDAYATTLADGTQAHNWRAIWLFAGGLSAVILVLFIVAFRERETENATS